tara:strand:+ start:829 stop:1545 length:717 start_codon:yes stop_codon:yes gene_type:complete
MRPSGSFISWTLFFYFIGVVGYFFYTTPIHTCILRSTYDFYVYETEKGFVAISEYGLRDLSDDGFDDEVERVVNESVRIPTRPRIDRGPFPEYFECTTRTNYLSSPESFRIDEDEYVDPQQRLKIYNAVVAFAKTEPYLAVYRPGQPPKWSFSLSDFVYESAKVLMIVGIPPALALFFSRVLGKVGNEIHDQRRQRGVCIHCEYDCADLPSPICPECGLRFATDDTLNTPERVVADAT